MKKTSERVSIDRKARHALYRPDLRYMTTAECADAIGAEYTDVWRARMERYVSPALLRAMAAAGYLDPHEVAAVLTVEVRPCPIHGEVHDYDCREEATYNKKEERTVKRKSRPSKLPEGIRTFAARVPDELFDEITAEARRLKMTNGEYLAHLFSNQGAEEEFLPRMPIRSGEIKVRLAAAGEE